MRGVFGRRQGGARRPLRGFKEDDGRDGGQWGSAGLGSSGNGGGGLGCGRTRKGDKVRALLRVVSVTGVFEVAFSWRKVSKNRDVKSGVWGWNVPEGEAAQGEGSGSRMRRRMGRKAR